MRHINNWLVDLMLFQRDGYHLHLFSLIILKGNEFIIKTPDFKIRMPIKAVPIKSEVERLEKIKQKFAGGQK